MEGKSAVLLPWRLYLLSGPASSYSRTTNKAQKPLDTAAADANLPRDLKAKHSQAGHPRPSNAVQLLSKEAGVACPAREHTEHLETKREREFPAATSLACSSGRDLPLE